MKRLRLLPAVCLLSFATTAVSPAQSETQSIVIAGIEGEAEMLAPGTQLSSPLTAGMKLPATAIIRSKLNSRFTLLLGSETVVRGGSDTEAEFLPGDGDQFNIRLNRGRLYFLHRYRPGRFLVRTPAVDATVLGTDFGMMVALNGVTTIDLMDGEVDFANSQGKVLLQGRAAAIAQPGKAPERTAVIELRRAVQWNLYYPAVVDVDELALDAETTRTIAESLVAYRSGNLLKALAFYPTGRNAESRAEQLYYAGLLLSVGEVAEAGKLLNESTAESTSAHSERLDSIERGLRRMISTVLAEPPNIQLSTPTNTATEWLAISYEQQGIADLNSALAAARTAANWNTNFSFAHARVAELEFSFGRTLAATRALKTALTLAPENAQAVALNGFLLAARNKFRDATIAFEQATKLDPALANGWLGLGLCRIHSRDNRGGLESLQIAAATEPTRALLRSYLAKAYAMNWDTEHATNEFAVAKSLDPEDPTAWLYSALFVRQEYRFNEAIADLETSKDLNDNRSIFRSRLKLDEDLAVRGANLAALYGDVGMYDVSVNEASQAVATDYANYSAHLFLANSYNQLRDPNLANLRYETATFSEYLIANLLSPVGGTPLSPRVSQQEYSSLFERNRLGLATETTYLSNGDWQQSASQYGWFKNTGYALDTYYLSRNGDGPNSDLEQKAFSIQLKQQLTPQDSIYAQAIFSDYDSGDVRRLYDPDSTSPYLSVDECQSPNLLVGYHHEWSPGNHTLFLGARLDDKFSLSDQYVLIPGVIRDRSTGEVVDTVQHYYTNAPGWTNPMASVFETLDYHSTFKAYTAELQHIARLTKHTLVVGARVQAGEITTSVLEGRGSSNAPNYGGLFAPNSEFEARQTFTTDLTRISAYGYDQWQMLDSLWLTAGLTYDCLRYPRNSESPPISDEETTESQLSPKAGFVWSPNSDSTVRGAFTRSLGGMFYDSSVRLEPVQIAGFNQAYRSLIPESVVGNVPGSQFQTFNLGFDQRFKSRTYLTIQGEWLTSDGSRDIGAFDVDPNEDIPATPYQIRQHLDFNEQSLIVSLNQLLGNEWALGTRYRISHAQLEQSYPDISNTVIPDTDNKALLQTVNLFAIYNHSSGFFAQAGALWFHQRNYDYDPDLDGDSFWQFNLITGYRFPRTYGEISVGLLNITDQNYHLNPLNTYQELPRDRILSLNLKLSF
ncbi:MAG TPA: FecR domain-containing protein [Verrucomicrobiota bacterium]|nr:FecR domain-containing protein [Verrucomicrobiota bacterium]